MLMNDFFDLKETADGFDLIPKFDDVTEEDVIHFRKYTAKEKFWNTVKAQISVEKAMDPIRCLSGSATGEVGKHIDQAYKELRAAYKLLDAQRKERYAEFKKELETQA